MGLDAEQLSPETGQPDRVQVAVKEDHAQEKGDENGAGDKSILQHVFDHTSRESGQDTVRG